MSVPLPRLTTDQFTDAYKSSWELIHTLTGHYNAMLAADPSGALMQQLTLAQHTLMALSTLHGQVCNGGFIQLIQNGFGPYIFENPFSAQIARMDAPTLAGLLDQAKEIYLADRTYLERETSLEEFTKMYGEFTAFEPIEAQFMEVIESEGESIAAFIATNLDQFVEIID